MIAIAGAKGGCGKTVTTLGLADALARRTSPTIAIDADRQLPNLHALANVDRKPTLAALSPDRDPVTVVQTTPHTEDVGIVSAPSAGESIDVESALDRFGRTPYQVVIDCPSGVGPDLVEAMTAADAVVAVTTATDESIHCANTTIDVARRLGVPVVGVIVNKAIEVPPSLDAEISVPILGRIPDTESESPVTAPSVREAFDDIAETLAAIRATDGTPIEHDGDRLPTGVTELDRTLGGGLPPGSIAALSADPASQSEHLLYELTASRGTLYLTTDRSEENVRSALESTPVSTGTPTIRRLDPDAPFEHAIRLIEHLPDRANLVLDAANTLERAERSRYVDFLNRLEDGVTQSDGIAIIHCHRGTNEPPNRLVTYSIADVVVDFRSAPLLERDVPEYTLSIPKCRIGVISNAVGQDIAFGVDHQQPNGSPPESTLGVQAVDAGVEDHT